MVGYASHCIDKNSPILPDLFKYISLKINKPLLLDVASKALCDLLND